jgi:hypothetical protein
MALQARRGKKTWSPFRLDGTEAVPPIQQFVALAAASVNAHVVAAVVDRGIGR